MNCKEKRTKTKRRDRDGVSSAIERRRMSRIIERGTHYPVIRPVASGAIGNSLLCLVGAVFNGWVVNESWRKRALRNGE